MNVELAPIPLPSFGAPDKIPEIPAFEFETRLQSFRKAVSEDWIVVYSDREHSANIAYLTGFDPRFEEALLVISPSGERYILAGNEDMSYAPLVRTKVEMVLCQSFSLMGQGRQDSPKLEEVLKELGLSGESSVGLAGWKYFESSERSEGKFFSTVPSFIVAAVEAAIRDGDQMVDITPVLMAPYGVRARNSVDQIAFYEWAATRTSQAVLNVMAEAQPGRSEFSVVSQMGYAGEPLSAHIMFASGDGEIVGLRSPSDRVLRNGDAVTTAIGYWGGLTCRAGLLARDDENFDREVGRVYFAAIATWYETIRVGILGGEVVVAVDEAFQGAGFGSTLNPGHLIHLDEWMHTPMVPAGTQPLVSGMALQCDIIPGPLRPGRALNCEDGIVLADEELREALATRHPQLMARVDRRRRFMREELGIEVSDDVLPLSSCPAYLPPFWLNPQMAYRKG